jgi:hypothetical protein
VETNWRALDQKNGGRMPTWWFWEALVVALFAITLLVSALAFIRGEEERLLECLGG